MLKFEHAKIVFIATMLLLISFIYFCKISFWWLLMPVLFFKVIIIYGAFKIQAKFFLPAIYSFPITEKKICLTFDDGPHPVVTPILLELLKKNNIKATFFCIGKNIQLYPQIAKQIFEEGHVIANHSYSHHKLIDLFPTKKIEKELIKTNELIFLLTNKKVKLFRPPFGITNPNIAKAVTNLKLTTIGWNIRSLDTVIKESNKVFERIIKRIKPGSIILLHDTDMNVIDVVEKVISYASDHGIAIVPIEELLSFKVYE